MVSTDKEITVCPPRYAAGYVRLELDTFHDLLPPLDMAQKNYKISRIGAEVLRGLNRK